MAWSPVPDLTVEDFHIAGHTISIERIRNLDDLVDQVPDEVFEQDERLPYWAELWPSAIAFSRYILHHKTQFAGKRIIELGCGLGLTSVALALCGPDALILTDYEQDALDMAGNNFLRNGLPLPELRLMDWRSAETTTRYDTIIASDVLYEERFFRPLLNLFNRFLEPGGRIYIAEPNRHIAQPFFRMAAAGGYIVNHREENVIQDGHVIRVNIFQLVK